MLLTGMQVAALSHLMRERADADAANTVDGSDKNPNDLRALTDLVCQASAFTAGEIILAEIGEEALPIAVGHPQVSALRCAYISEFMRRIGEHFAEQGAKVREDANG